MAGDDLQQLTQGRTLRGSATCPGIMFPPTPCACVASFATQSAARPNHVSRRLHSSCGGHAFSVNSTFSTPIRPPAPSGVVDQLVCPPRYSLLPRRAAPPGPPRIIRFRPAGCVCPAVGRSLGVPRHCAIVVTPNGAVPPSPPRPVASACIQTLHFSLPFLQPPPLTPHHVPRHDILSSPLIPDTVAQRMLPPPPPCAASPASVAGLTSVSSGFCR